MLHYNLHQSPIVFGIDAWRSAERVLRLRLLGIVCEHIDANNKLRCFFSAVVFLKLKIENWKKKKQINGVRVECYICYGLLFAHIICIESLVVGLPRFFSSKFTQVVAAPTEVVVVLAVVVYRVDCSAVNGSLGEHSLNWFNYHLKWFRLGSVFRIC